MRQQAGLLIAAAALCVPAVSGAAPRSLGSAVPGALARTRHAAVHGTGTVRHRKAARQEAEAKDAGAPRDRADVRAVIEGWEKAFRAKDMDGVMAMYAPDVVAFDAVPPLQYKGSTAYRGNYQKFFEQYAGPVEVELRELNITAGGNTAFSSGLMRVGGVSKTGENSSVWLRITDCFRKMHGKWTVVHEHVSAPVDFDTGKGVLDLKP